MALTDDRRKWNARHAEALARHPGAGPHPGPKPHPLALRWRREMRGGRMLDAACGQGRGVAAAGHLFHTIYGVDLSDVALSAARRLFAHLPARWIAADVTQLAWPANHLGLVCAFGFTDLPFFRRLRELIAPQGMFLYEGFSRTQLQVNPGLDPAWTSTPAEMADLFAGWRVLELGESAEPPFLTRFAAVRAAAGA